MIFSAQKEGIRETVLSMYLVHSTASFEVVLEKLVRAMLKMISSETKEVIIRHWNVRKLAFCPKLQKERKKIRPNLNVAFQWRRMSLLSQPKKL